MNTDSTRPPLDPYAAEPNQTMKPRAANAAMRAAGLTGGYAGALATGYWTSGDVLPEAEQARRGRRLDPPAVVWVAPYCKAS